MKSLTLLASLVHSTLAGLEQCMMGLKWLGLLSTSHKHIFAFTILEGAGVSWENSFQAAVTHDPVGYII